MPPTFDELLPHALQRATDHIRCRPDGSHGVDHWRRVAQTGGRLAALTRGADPVVVECFAVLHDSQRASNGSDPKHGERAATTARELHADGLLPISDAQLAILAWACAEHTRSGPVTDPTIGCCFDSDRLDLRRFGSRPLPIFLPTDAGRQEAGADRSP